MSSVLSPDAKIKELRERIRELKEAKEKKIKKIWDRKIGASHEIAKLAQKWRETLEEANEEEQKVRDEYEPQIEALEKERQELVDKLLKKGFQSYRSKR